MLSKRSIEEVHIGCDEAQAPDQTTRYPQSLLQDSLNQEQTLFWSNHTIRSMSAFPAKVVEGTFHTQHLSLARANVDNARHVIMGFWLQLGFSSNFTPLSTTQHSFQVLSRPIIPYWCLPWFLSLIAIPQKLLDHGWSHYCIFLCVCNPFFMSCS